MGTLIWRILAPFNRKFGWDKRRTAFICRFKE